MLIFIKKINFKPGNQVRSLVPVPKFHYPEPNPFSTGSKNLESVLDPIRPVSGLEPPGPNRFRVPGFFAQP